MNINVRVDDQKLIVPSCKTDLVSGTQEFVIFTFQFSEDWNGLTVFAQFKQGDNTYNQFLDDNNRVYLPAEIEPGQCTLTIFGSGGNTRATANFILLTINENILVSDAQSTEITLSLYEQLVNKINSMDVGDVDDIEKTSTGILIKYLDGTSKRIDIQGSGASRSYSSYFLNQTLEESKNYINFVLIDAESEDFDIEYHDYIILTISENADLPTDIPDYIRFYANNEETVVATYPFPFSEQFIAGHNYTTIKYSEDDLLLISSNISTINQVNGIIDEKLIGYCRLYEGLPIEYSGNHLKIEIPNYSDAYFSYSDILMMYHDIPVSDILPTAIEIYDEDEVYKATYSLSYPEKLIEGTTYLLRFIGSSARIISSNVSTVSQVNDIIDSKVNSNVTSAEMEMYCC